jgi:hypothetical protein
MSTETKKAPVWTKQDDKILQNHMKNAPTPKEGFKSAAEVLNRTEGAVSFHWYNVLKKKPKAVVKHKKKVPPLKASDKHKKGIRIPTSMDPTITFHYKGVKHTAEIVVNKKDLIVAKVSDSLIIIES